MQMKLKNLSLGAAVLLLGACAWVRPEPGAEGIALLPEARVQDCERLGSVEVSVVERILGMDRHDEQVESDLANLARNHAAEQGGDTIAPLGPVRDGKRRFGVYRCGEEAEARARDDDEGVEVRGYER
jgi:hypothetical protein